MSFNWARIGTGVLLLVIIMGCAGIGVSSSGQESRKSVVVTIDLDRRQEFFDQLREFAEANGFSILIDTLSSSNEEFQVYMKRDDIFISGATGELDKYYIGFYDANVRRPAPDSVFEDLVSQLEQYVSEVPGTTFLIRK